VILFVFYHMVLIQSNPSILTSGMIGVVTVICVRAVNQATIRCAE
jgi:hypothetical protein